MLRAYTPLAPGTFEELDLATLLTDIELLDSSSWSLLGVTEVEKGEIPGFSGGNPGETVQVMLLRSKAARPSTATVPVSVQGLVFGST